MSDNNTPAPPIVKALQIFGVATGAFLSGFAFSASHLGVQAVRLAPAPLRASQFLVIYSQGALVSPPLAVASLLAWGFVSYSTSGSLLDGGRKGLFALAGALTFAVLPWTVLVMTPTNRRLGEIARAVRAGKEGRVDEAEVQALLTSWDRMNYVRALIPLVGGVVGLWGLLQ